MEEEKSRPAEKNTWAKEMDRDQINMKCQKILDNIGESLIDLNFEMNHSMNELSHKQDQIKTELT